MMVVLAASLLLGLVAGARSMMPLAALAWGCYLGAVDPGDGWLAWLESPYASVVFAVLALGELVGDKLPFTPSRKMLVPFAGRIITGAFCGGVLALEDGLVPGGVVAGGIGALVGTLGGHWVRAELAAAFNRDLPAALIEDAAAILLAAMAIGAVA